MEHVFTITQQRFSFGLQEIFRVIGSDANKQAIGKLEVYATLNVSAATTGVGPLHCIIDEVSEKNHTRDIEFHLRGLEVD